MDTFVVNVMDDLFGLANEVLALECDTRRIDRLSAARRYSQLLGTYAVTDEYLRKFQQAMGQFRSFAEQKSTSLMANPCPTEDGYRYEEDFLSTSSGKKGRSMRKTRRHKGA